MSNIVGQNIKRKREELKWTQTDLAKKLGYKSRVSVSTVESGKEDITTERVAMFAKALGCSPAELMGWTEEEKQAKTRIGIYMMHLTDAFSKASEKDKKIICSILEIPYDEYSGNED